MPRSDASLRCDCAPSRSTDSNRPSTIRAFSESSLRAACGIPHPCGSHHYLVHGVNVKPNVQILNAVKPLKLNDIHFDGGNKLRSTRPQIACAATIWIC